MLPEMVQVNAVENKFNSIERHLMSEDKHRRFFTSF